ncbi:MAG: metalloregulator ArsR/SmtB family transcription factor [Tessaracoccus sp.]
MAVTTPHPVALSALADETRWNILVRLGSSPASASRLAAEFPVSRQAIAKHISVLQGAGLVVPERVGREVRFVALGSKLSQLARELERIATGWDRRLAALKDHAEGEGGLSSQALAPWEDNHGWVG